MKGTNREFATKFYFERFTSQQPVTPQIIDLAAYTANNSMTISAYFRFG